ncbi:hypothetical protein IJ579_04315 [bacterium]|nr:hypothetical protein [bacterium]
MKKILAILFILCLALPVCAKKRQSETVIVPMKQLEKREYQTRTYDNLDKQFVTKALLNVYQDEGFIIYNVNSLLGFIYASKDYNIADSETDISKEFGFTKSRLSYNGVNVATLESSVNITDYGKDLKIRVNFRRKLFNMYGNAQFIEDLNDEEYYQKFFEKVENAIQLQKQSIKTIQDQIQGKNEQTSAESEKQEPQVEQENNNDEENS